MSKKHRAQKRTGQRSSQGHSGEGRAKLTRVAAGSWWESTRSWVAIAIAAVALLVNGYSSCIQKKRLDLQKSSQAKLGKRLDDSRDRWDAQFQKSNSLWTKQFDATRDAFLQAGFYEVLASLSSGKPEQRLAALRSAKAYMDKSEYRDSITPAIIETIGKRIMGYTRHRSIQVETIEPDLRVAGVTLLASSNCDHLRSVIRGLYAKLKLAGDLQSQLSGLRPPERRRRTVLLAALRRHIGTGLFCSYLPTCANDIDFDNAMNGWSTFSIGLVQVGGGTQAIPPDALTSLSGYAHVVPHDFRSPLVSLVHDCAPDTRVALKERACSRSVVGEGGKLSRTPSCAVLSTVSFFPDGWTAFGATITTPHGRTIRPGTMKVR